MALPSYLDPTPIYKAGESQLPSYLDPIPIYKANTPPDTKPSKPKPKKDTARPSETWRDWPRIGWEGMKKGAAWTIDSMANAPTNVVNLAKAGAGILATEAGYPELAPEITDKPAPIQAKLLEQWGVTSPDEPQTIPGRMVDFTGQVIGGGGSLNPLKVLSSGGVKGGAKEAVRQVAQSTATGVAGSGAKELAATQTDDPYLQGGAALLGAILGGKPFAGRASSGVIANEALEGVDEATLQQAQRLMTEAYAMGTPITGAEAIAHGTGGNRLQDVQRVVERSRTGGPIMQPMMNARPEANERAFARMADTIAPAPATPAAVPGNLQQAALSAVDEVKQARTNAVQPYYQAAADELVAGSKIQAILDKIDEAIRNVGEGSATGKVLMKMREQYAPSGTPGFMERIGPLDTAYKEFRDMFQATPLEPTAIQATAKGVAKPLNKELGMLLERDNANIAQGRRLYQDLTRDELNPVIKSPVGDLAGMKAKNAESLQKQQGEVLMPATPRTLDEATIRATVAKLNKQDPTAVQDFVRQNLKAIFDEATQNLVSGPNQWGGAKYAAIIAGNAQQAKNLKALIESLPNGKQAYAGFRRMLDVFEAQGKRHAPGSQTEFNKQITEELSKSGAGAVAATAASPGRLALTIRDWYDNFRYGKNAAEMAEILTRPDSVRALQELARHAPQSHKAQLIVAGVLAAGRDIDKQEQD